MYMGGAAPSPAGPAEAGEALNAPPAVALPHALQMLRFTQRQIEFVFRARRELGEVFQMQAGIPGGTVVSSHPDHVRSLFTAKPEHVPSLTAESPLRPIVGPNSVLTANGPRHLRQRKLLLPPFHGEAIERYAQMIAAGDRARARPLADRPPVRARAADAGDHARGDHGRDLRNRGPPRPRERRARDCAPTIKYLTAASTSALAKLGELANIGREEPVGLMRRRRAARPRDLSA